MMILSPLRLYLQVQEGCELILPRTKYWLFKIEFFDTIVCSNFRGTLLKELT